jgi:hypothetical protein
MPVVIYVIPKSTAIAPASVIEGDRVKAIAWMAANPAPSQPSIFVTGELAIDAQTNLPKVRAALGARTSSSACSSATHAI